MTQSVHIDNVSKLALREGLLATAWRFLDQMQDPKTGYWGIAEADNTKPYMMLNGTHKIVQF